MTLMLAVGIPVFLVLGCTLLALSVSADDRLPETSEAKEKVKAPQALVSFQPMGWSSQAKETPIEDIVTNIERHLRAEQKAASQFAKDPSFDSLRAD